MDEDLFFIPDVFDVTEALVECESAISEYEGLVAIRPVVMESEDSENPSWRNIRFESAESSIWDKIKNALKRFFGAIRRLFSSLWEKLKTAFFDTESKWFEYHRWELQTMFERYKNPTIKVKVRNYNTSIDLISTYLQDIDLVDKSIDKLYDLGETLVGGILKDPNPKNHKFWDVKKAEAKNEMIIDITNTWNDICRSLNLKIDTNNPLAGDAIKSSILGRFYVQAFIDKSQKTTEVEPSSFISDYQGVEKICSEKSTTNIKRICDKIKRGSVVMESYLRDLDSYINKISYSGDDSEDFKKMQSFLMTVKTTVVSILQTIPKLSMILGTQYWLIYMHLRGDTLRVCKAWYSAYNSSKNDG